MAQPTTQPSLPQHRSQFSPPPNQARDFTMANGHPSSFSAASPQTSVHFSTPSLQQYPSQHTHPPPQKRPRLSPEVASPLSNPSPAFQQAGTPHAGSPSMHNSFNASSIQAPKPGLMAPPQKPIEKNAEDNSYNDLLAGTGVNIEEEERNLNRPEYMGQGSQQFSRSFSSTQTSSFSERSGTTTTLQNGTQESQISDEEKLQRDHARADWEAARHAQHALWDMFLYGGTLNEKIKKFSADEHLVEAQAGVLVNTQRNAPPPIVRVNGLEGASKVIDRGQSILDTKDKAERLSDIMKLVSLAAKSRLTGILNSAARLAVERRQHSKGMVPDDWTDVAAKPQSAIENSLEGSTSAQGTSSKRTHAQANEEPSNQAVQHPAIDLFDKIASSSRIAEEARLAKRQKRKAKATDDKDGADMESADAVLAAALDSDKKTTKKERKATESKFAEQQQHKNANEAARLATSSMIGRTFGKKGKSYSWMTGGGSGAASAPSTPGRGITSSQATPGTITPVVPRGRRFQDWDEDVDAGITAKDFLLILEHDPQAARSYIKGCSIIDGKET